mmetsp:Transcript_14218/g.30864  ORF Transcript_14218/g.30864 Transcript_14218/m.30864 type:complete len:184 (+) Transcript_14218:341-892(+)
MIFLCSCLFVFVMYGKAKAKKLVNTSVEDSLGKDLLGDLGTHVGIAELGGNEDAADLGLLGVDLVDLHLDAALGDVEGLVVLAEEGGVAFLAGLEAGEGDGHVVTGGTAAALGIKEETGTVRGGVEIAAHLEARLEGRTVALGDQVLDGEEERDALPAGELDGGGGVVDSLLLVEGDLPAVGR